MVIDSVREHVHILEAMLSQFFGQDGGGCRDHVAFSIHVLRERPRELLHNGIVPELRDGNVFQEFRYERVECSYHGNPLLVAILDPFLAYEKGRVNVHHRHESL